MHGKKPLSDLQRKDTVVLYFTRHCKVSKQDKYKKYYYIFRMLYFTRNNKKYAYLIRSIYDNWKVSKKFSVNLYWKILFVWSVLYYFHVYFTFSCKNINRKFKSY